MPAQLAAVNWYAAGIASGAQAHWGAVPPASDSPPVRRFGACTVDLEASASWLPQRGVTTGAMESTGVYWIPLFELREARGFTVVLADARAGQRAPGRPKTEGQDWQGLPRLHTYGRLAAALRPPEQVCVLCSSLRPRTLLVPSASPPIEPLPQARTPMTSKLPHVLSEVPRGTGLAILQALVSGARAPATLAPVRARHCPHRAAASARARPGHGRAAPRLALPQAREVYECSHRPSAAGAHPSAAHRQPLADHRGGKPLPPAPRIPTRRRHEPPFAARLPLLRATGVALTASEGINEHTALVLLSELGADMNGWPTEKPLAAGLGLCPLHQLSGGQVLSRKIRPSANRAALALRLAARCLHHSPQCAGRVLAPLEGAPGDTQSGRGHRPQTGPLGVSVTQVWRSLCGTRNGGVRACLPGTRRETSSAHGQGVGLSAASDE